jgi:YidC/Oxa1 family membrane protein insertase
LFITDLWDQFVVQAIFVRALEFLYESLASFSMASWGLVIIVFTFIVKTLTLPLTLKSVRSMRKMQLLAPELKELQRQYKDDKAGMAQAQMQLYSQHQVSPVAGCLPMLVQMPIWIALYSALFHLANSGLYPEFAQPFLWINNLGAPEFTPENFPREWPILAVLTGVTQWITTRMSMQPSTDPQTQTMNQVMQFMPLMFIFFSLSVPAGLVLYWVASNVYQMVQQYFISGWGQLIPSQTTGQAAAPSRGNQSGSSNDAASNDSRTSAVKQDRSTTQSSGQGRRRRNKRR